MLPNGRLLAWIAKKDTQEFVAAFVGEGAVATSDRKLVGRAPATQVCSSVDDARQWVQEQAEAFRLPVQWLDAAPGR
jgi:hypothetical protein